MSNYQNLSQERAIKKIKGPCIILAGAGTGKTFTIVEKIKHLITKKIYKPEKIVCITFSNEAANNLLFRVRNALELETEKEPIIKTFHAFSSVLLKKHGGKIRIDKNFTVLDSDEAKVILHTSLKIPANDCPRYINEIGKAKDLGIKIENIENYLEEKNVLSYQTLKEKLETLQIKAHTLDKKDFKNRKKEDEEEIKKISKFLELRKFINSWQAYEKIKIKENYQDYADLNTNALKLLKEFPEIAQEYDYIIVDEFQDTNKIQLDFLFSLAVKNNITVVGDLNQSIYRFRGAYKENFVLFKEHFKVADNEIFNLDKSFRSPNKILRTAHKLITLNYQNPLDSFLIENAKSVEGSHIEVYQLKNSQEEARKCFEIIENEIKNGKKPEDICIIYRTHQQGEIIKRVLELKNLPYYSLNKKSLLKYDAIKLTKDFLTIINNITKEEKGGLHEWWDLVYQNNFSEQDLIEIGKFMHEKRISKNVSKELFSSLENLNLTSEGKIKVKSIIEKIKILLPSSKKSLTEILEEVYKVLGIMQTEKEYEPEIMLNLNKFYELASNYSKKSYSNLSSFLNYLEILEKLNIQIDSAEIEKEGVRIMSAHATKGLEFKTIILTNLAEKRFPIEKTRNNSLIPLELYPEIKNCLETLDEKQKEIFIEKYEKENQMFDERRLCYVAFTRAKEKLFVTYAEQYKDKKYSPSVFLEEINFKNNEDIKFISDSEEKFPELEKNKKSSDGLKIVLTSNLKKEKDYAFLEKEKTFSPSALLAFIECQKKFEYKYIYNMPEKEVESWESMKIGSFVHLILEQGVKKNFKTLKEFENLAQEMYAEEEWLSLDLSEVLFLIKIFFERNKNKFNENSLTEHPLFMKIEGLNFFGKADRIDFTQEGIEIIDYKTGKMNLPMLNRNWQLGYYALAASKLGKVKKIILDMLRQEKPLEFEIDDKGNASEQYSKRISFNINEIKKEIVNTTKSIIEAYKTSFKPCPIEKNCKFCNEFVYKKK